MSTKNDPKIAARESEAARQEQGYLDGDKETTVAGNCRKCGRPKEPSRPKPKHKK